MVKYELLNTINQSPLKKKQACKVLGLNLKRFYFWQSLYDTFGLQGLIDRPPKPKCITNRLLPEEERAIEEYSLKYSRQHHREIQFNKEHKILKPKKPYQKPEATAPLSDWLVDLAYILVNKAFCYLIVVIDLFSRYVVGWELFYYYHKQRCAKNHRFCFSWI